MHVALQASVSESQDKPAKTVEMMMMTMQKNQEASEQRNITMLEQQKKDMKMRMEQQRKDMDQSMEQQRKNLITIS
jgi:hypothetical protein